MLFTSSISRKIKWFIYKSLSLLSIVRGYNVLVIMLAQYLTSLFILSKNIKTREVLFDANLLSIVLASAISIASGYIINNFYDSEKDLINRPQKSKLDRLISQQKKLTIYFIFNFIAVIIASYVSFKAVLFFSAYIFGIWFYSHKLKRIPIVGNLAATFLAILPFFAIFIYYKNYDCVIFVHAIFLVLIIFMRELVKDLENLKGDIASGYNTIPAAYGEKTSKYILYSVIAINICTALIITKKFPLGYMSYYFWFGIGLLILFGTILYMANQKKQYILLHNILKFIIVTGVLSIPLLEPSIFAKIL